MMARCVQKDGPHQLEPAPKQVLKYNGTRLFTVTTIAASSRFGGTRTVMVTSSFDRAREVIETNEGDIFETSYRLAVIDTIVDGWLYHTSNARYWYMWVGSVGEGGYQPIEEPGEYNGIVSVGGVG